MSPTIAVVGASLAGLTAARALRDQSYDGRIVVIGDEVHAPYDRPPLSKDFLAGAASLDDIALGTPDDAELGLEWRLGTTAVGLDRPSRSVLLDDGSEIRADGVVLATGARARRLAGSDGLDGVHVLRSLDDAIALREDLATASRLVVIGAGFIGAEVASTARTLGLDVTVVEAMPVPLAGPLGADMGAVCAGLHADHGTRLPADVVVVGIGAIPNIEWLADSGVALGNGVLTDARGVTTIPGVVAVGDCAASWSVSAERHVRTEHWTHALEQPATAVATLLGAEGAAGAAVPYFWSDQYGARIQFAGSRREDDVVRVVEGSCAERSFLVAYERDGVPVAVLGMNQPRLFTRWRRQLRSAVPATA